MIIPVSARPIIHARTVLKKKPADMVLVSLVGPLDDANPVITVDDRTEYDYSYLRGLQVAVFVEKTKDWRRVVADVAKAKPKELIVWDVDTLKGAWAHYLPRAATIDMPCSQWEWELTFVSFMPKQNMEFANAAYS